jgi:uncharacterized protein (DUF1501 family)
VSHCDRRSLLRAAGALPFVFGGRGLGAWVPRGDGRALLVLELEGGNDGLNTVIPADDARYAKARPKLQEVRTGSHGLADGTALHPRLGRLHRLVRDGNGAVVHGVGYGEPDRSHFRSRDIWHVADPGHVRVAADTTGWLGRAADRLAASTNGVPAAAVGGLEVPLVLKGREVQAPSLSRVEDFQWLAVDPAGAVARSSPTRAALMAATAGAGGLRGFVADTARRAAALADELATALARYRPHAEYPATELGQSLQLAARLVVSGFGTRLLHARMPGFDTHARQLPTHAGLLGQLDEALGALLADLAGHGCAERVVVLVHSEFGRRVAENASQGTDHGAAGPVFLFGGGVTGGVHGPVPDLQRLDDGDLVATMDFRRLYAEVLQWLSVDAVAVLGGAFEPAGVLVPARR